MEGNRRGRPPSPERVLHELVAEFHHLAVEVGNIAKALGRPQPEPEIGLRAIMVRGKGFPMANIDRGTLNLLDTEGTILSIAAKDGQGNVGGIPANQFEWTSADPANAAIADQTPHTDDRELTGYERWVGTPGTANASVVITVKHVPSGNTETLTLNIQSTQPGEIGLSAGSPVLEP